VLIVVVTASKCAGTGGFSSVV